MLIDPLSFALGFVTASIFWWLVAKARPLWDEMRAGLNEQREIAQTRKTSSVEENHRRITLRRAQGMHLAAPLFALDEILQEPLLIIPPQPVDPSAPHHFEDVYSQTLPYLPAWPEIAAAYNAPAFTLPQALSGNANIVIIGHPGTGKSVALAHLASLTANRSEKIDGALQDIVPFLIHVADLNLPAADPKNILAPIISAVSEHAPLLDLSRIPAFVENTFKIGKALLLVDGFDEIPAAAQQPVSDYFKQINQSYSKTRIVTTGAPDYLDGLIGNGFAPLALMTWSAQQSDTFIDHWGKLWDETIGRESSEPQIDALILNTWIKTSSANLSPLELTLKTWGSYAGDILGPHVLEAIATHILRILPANTPLAALETLAMQSMLSAQPIFDPRTAREWVKSFEGAEEKLAGEDSTLESAEATAEDAKSKKGKRGEKAPTSTSGLIDKMVTSGLLIAYPDNKTRFTHSVFAGYLAGRALTNYNADESLINQKDWSGKYLTIQYLGAHGDIGNIVQAIMGSSQLPTHRPLFAAARWLRDAPKNAAWRGKLFGALATILQTDGTPLNLRGQALAAFVFSADASAFTLFRQLMTTASYELTQLAALGSGAARDSKAVAILTESLMSLSIAVRRAACMALVSIGTNEALEVVAQTLLNGDEDIRRAAAEALANDKQEGYAMLRDGITLSDILLRRSVIYGLGRVNETWADEILQKVQVEDDQWVVRNAATEVLDAKNNSGAIAPRKLKVPAESAWLVEFAAKQGMGISPGTPATDVLLHALKSDDINFRLAALPYLKYTPSESVVAEMYTTLYADDAELREATFNILWELDAAGVKLPNPAQYGYN